jgi:hypothetical protein
MLSTDGYETDKSWLTPRYEQLFAPLRDRPLRLLELGVDRGGSLKMWRDYFPSGSIVGLDAEEISLDEERIRVYRGLQQDTALLDRIGAECAPDGFDVIIDDASHIGELTRTSFWHLFTRWLAPGGIYAIEDWGTGYWRDWPDGSPSGSGMVGFLKELVDEVGVWDRTHPTRGTPPQRAPRISRLGLSPGLAIVWKNARAAY